MTILKCYVRVEETEVSGLSCSEMVQGRLPWDVCNLSLPPPARLCKRIFTSNVA